MRLHSVSVMRVRTALAASFALLWFAQPVNAAICEGQSETICKARRACRWIEAGVDEAGDPIPAHCTRPPRARGALLPQVNPPQKASEPTASPPKTTPTRPPKPPEAPAPPEAPPPAPPKGGPVPDGARAPSSVGVG